MLKITSNIIIMSANTTTESNLKILSESNLKECNRAVYNFLSSFIDKHQDNFILVSILFDYKKNQGVINYHKKDIYALLDFSRSPKEITRFDNISEHGQPSRMYFEYKLPAHRVQIIDQIMIYDTQFGIFVGDLPQKVDLIASFRENQNYYGVEIECTETEILTITNNLRNLPGTAIETVNKKYPNRYRIVVQK